MSGRRYAAIAFLGVVLAACSAGATPVPSIVVRASPLATTAPAESTEAATPSAETPTAPPPTPTPKPTPRPTSKPTAKPIPVPPKLTGVDFEYCCGLGGDGVSRLGWKVPRTKGVEIRVYGVTTCFPASDGVDETCLREHTSLPDDVRVLLAKGPASKGKLSWHQDEGEGEGCVAEFLSKNGTSFYSIVAAAYNARGHSTFAIVESGYADMEACTPYVIQGGDTLRGIAAQFNVTVDDLIAANKSTLPNPNKLRVGATILIPQPAE
jgi:hypothetical protein